MTVDVMVHLDGHLAAHVDNQVRTGRASTHEDAVKRLLECERRMEMAHNDAQIYLNDNDEDDLNGLARWATNQPLDD